MKLLTNGDGKLHPIVLDSYQSPTVKQYWECSPEEARVLSTFKDVTRRETLFWNESPTRFQIIHKTDKYRVSKTLRRYSAKEKTRMVLVDVPKFHLVEHRKIQKLRFSNLQKLEIDIFFQKFHWMRFLEEHKLTYEVCLETIFKKKLFTAKKVMSYAYCGLPYPDAKRLHETELRHQAPGVKKDIYSQIDFTPGRINFDIFENLSHLCDCVKMAKSLGERINGSWSVRRLTEEHDRWSRRTTEILFSANNQPLEIRPQFKKLAEVMGDQGTLITDTKALAIEGMRQQHCVAGYDTQINYGHCAIFHYKGYTLEIKYVSGERVTIGQFLGYKNKLAPTELFDEIKHFINQYHTLNNITEVKYSGCGAPVQAVAQACGYNPQPF